MLFTTSIYNTVSVSGCLQGLPPRKYSPCISSASFPFLSISLPYFWTWQQRRKEWAGNLLCLVQFDLLLGLLSLTSTASQLRGGGENLSQGLLSSPFLETTTGSWSPLSSLRSYVKLLPAARWVLCPTLGPWMEILSLCIFSSVLP